MFVRLLILFTVVPLIELALLIKLGNLIGLWPTISIVIVTGVLGAALARNQGTRTVVAIRAELAEGRAPTESLLNGLLILVGGVVLLTPGLLTDLLGFSLLIPLTPGLPETGSKKNFKTGSGNMRRETPAPRP